MAWNKSGGSDKKDMFVAGPNTKGMFAVDIKQVD